MSQICSEYLLHGNLQQIDRLCHKYSCYNLIVLFVELYDMFANVNYAYDCFFLLLLGLLFNIVNKVHNYKPDLEKIMMK